MARTLTIVICFMVALSATSAESHAQGGSIQSRIHSGLVGLALQSEVAKEIGIKEDRETMAEILKWSNDIIEESRRTLNDVVTQRQSISEETRQRLRTMHDLDLKAVLADDQFTRLQQIDWQIRDRNALTEPDVMDALEMTDQQEKLVEAQQEFRTKMRELSIARRQTKMFPEDADKKRRELIVERDSRVDQILTKAQQEKFAEIKGKPFAGPESYWYEKYSGGGSKPKSQ